MFMPERMTLIRVVAPIDYIEETILALIESRVFQNTSRHGRGLYAERARRTLTVVEEILSRLNHYLGIVGARVSRREVERIEPRPDSVSLFLEELIEKSKIVDSEFEDLLNRYREYETRTGELETLVGYLYYLRDIDLDLQEVFTGEHIRSRLFVVSLERVSEFLRDLDRKLSTHLVLYRPTGDQREAVGIVVYSVQEESSLNELFRAYRVRVLEIPETYRGNIGRAYIELSRELERVREFMRELRATARERFEKIRELFLETYRGLYIVRDFMRIASHAYFTEEHVVIEGFVPSRYSREVVDRILRETRELALVETRDIERLERLEEEPPTYYRIPDILRPFKMIHDLYGPPSYSEVIPVYLVAVTFPMIFGLMFPDLGHGLALLVAGIFMFRYFSSRDRGLSDLGLLLVYLGIASMTTGLLSGEFFGPATPVARFLEEMYEKIHVEPPLAMPIYKPGAGVTEALYSFILLSVRIATSTLFVSSLLGFINSLINREYEYMIALALPRLTLFTSIMIPAYVSGSIEEVGSIYSYISLGQLLGLLGVPSSLEVPTHIEVIKWALNISLLWILLGEFIIESIRHGVSHSISRLGSGLIEVFDTVVVAIGNSISYLRIMGIALAHIAVVVSFYVPVMGLLYSTNVIEQIAAWTVYSIGNLLAMTLEAVIAFAHTLRLHLYEMFSKFYRGTGKLYEPYTPVLYTVELVSL